MKISSASYDQDTLGARVELANGTGSTIPAVAKPVCSFELFTTRWPGSGTKPDLSDRQGLVVNPQWVEVHEHAESNTTPQFIVNCGYAMAERGHRLRMLAAHDKLIKMPTRGDDHEPDQEHECLHRGARERAGPSERPPSREGDGP